MTIARRVGTRFGFGILVAVLGLISLSAAPGLAKPAGSYHVTNLVSDQPGVATVHDPSLVGAWGIALSPTGGAFWVSSNGADVATLYTGDFTRADGSLAPFAKAALTVSIPVGAPTGQVFNPTDDFVITNGVQFAPAIFIFATATGYIAGWNPAVPPATTSWVAVAPPQPPVVAPVYTGLAIGNNGTANFIYAADYGSGTIAVFDRTFSPATLEGSFTDPDVPAIYRPFNIQNLGGKLFVTYAIRDRGGDGLPSGGAGFVSVFDTNGNLLDHLIVGAGLAAPWGLALAPSDFGAFNNALLVGNFGSGRISAYDPATGSFLGQLRDESGAPIVIDGLLGLTFGNGVTAGDRNALYFAAGPNGMMHGLFGSIRAIPD